MHLYYDDLSNIDYLSVERERFPDWKFQHYCRDIVAADSSESEARVSATSAVWLD